MKFPTPTKINKILQACFLFYFFNCIMVILFCQVIPISFTISASRRKTDRIPEESEFFNELSKYTMD